MKLLLTALLALGLAVGFGALALHDPGYVLLVRAPYSVQLPLALFVLFALAAFAALYASIGLLASLLRAPARFRDWRRHLHRERVQLQTVQGYAGLIEGDWRKAEQKLLARLEHNQAPLLNYLGAAYAAQQRGDLGRRDRHLDAALAEHPRQRLAIGLTRARLHYQAGEITAARRLLERLRKIAPGNAAVARLLADVYRGLGEWRALAALLPSLARLRAFPPEDFAARERQAYARYLSSAPLLDAGGAKSLRAFYALPPAARRDPNIIAGYAARLLKAGKHRLAEEVLRRALAREWDAELAYLYGRTETAFAGEQIKLAEDWVRKYGSHPDLTLTLARLHRRDRQLEKARELFAYTIAHGGRAEARAELGALLEDLGEHTAALACYRPEADAAPEEEPATDGADALAVMPMVR
ncbi:MAG: tetratricopeptide repeat protein [Gammaproteobacteria bacterium]|nr:tetratricopeptide repeat protein [Gammaproteobacteria bacterium]